MKIKLPKRKKRSLHFGEKRTGGALPKLKKFRLSKKESNRGMSVKGKILLAFIANLVLLGIVNIIMFISNADINQKYESLLNDINVSYNVKNEASGLHEAMRDYIINLNTDREKNHKETFQQIKNQIGELQANAATKAADVKLQGIANMLDTLMEKAEEIEKHMADKDLSSSIDANDEFKRIAGFFDTNIQEYILLQLANVEAIGKELSQRYHLMMIINIGAIIVIVVISLFIVSRLIKDIVNPLTGVCNNARLIAAGNLNVEELNVKTKDELKELGDAFNQMSRNLRGIVQTVNDISKKVFETSLHLNESTEQNSKAGEEISVSIEEMAAGISTQTNEIEQMDNNIKKMYDISSLIEENSEKILERTNHSVKISQEGSTTIGNFTEQMKTINQTADEISVLTEEMNSSSEQMNGIVNVIASIASQTNLLALNASIEAARAGESGRGFAVVAEEIRKLAEESTDSSKKNAELIKQVQQGLKRLNEHMSRNVNEIEKGNEIAGQAAECFRSIQDASITVNDEIKENTIQMTDLVKRMDEVNTSIESNVQIVNVNESSSVNISAVVQEQTANLEEVLASTNILKELAEDLENAVKKFSI